jgi:hypothetical protein
VADIYVDPAATGAADGSSWADAFTSLQAGIDALAEGDTIYCRGTETPVATTITKLAGGAAGFNRIIGCNASGDVDGTTYKINGASLGGTSVIAIDLNHVRWFVQNVEIYGHTGTAIQIGPASTYCYNILFNITIRNGYGGIHFIGYFGMLYRCHIYAVRACLSNASGAFFFCSFHSTTLSAANIIGFYAANAYLFGCLIYDAPGQSAYANLAPMSMTNCVIDGGNGNAINYDQLVLLNATRITNNAGYGYTGTNVLFDLFNFINNNSSGYSNGHANQFIKGSESTGTQGYVDRTNKDFRLTTSATLRGAPVPVGSIPNNGINKMHMTAGMVPETTVNIAKTTSRASKAPGVAHG